MPTKIKIVDVVDSEDTVNDAYTTKIDAVREAELHDKDAVPETTGKSGWQTHFIIGQQF